MSKNLSVEDQVLHVYVAIQHLQHDRSTVDLADELGLSRFMVGRMIKRARDEGLIEVVPRLSLPVDTAMSRELTEKYHLNSAIVVTPPRNTDTMTRGVIARLAAQLITELIDEDDIVGLGPGRTIVAACDRIVDVPPCDVVQVTGVANAEQEENLHAIMQLSRAAKGRMYPLYAPFLATNAASARTIAAEPSVRQALQRMDRLDKIVLTVGGWPHSSLLANHLGELGQLNALLDRGVVAEFGTTLLDADGHEIHILEDRLIGITTRQLAQIPVRVALGGGPGKRQAVIAALKSGLVNVLVTDQHSAQAAVMD